MSFSNILDKTPRWVIVVAGAVVGISVLSTILRHAMTTGEDTTLWTFSLAHFSGYLFFIISPVEILYVHMLGEGHDGLLLIQLALATALGAQVIDYGIGYAFSGTVIDNVIGEKKYKRYLRRIDQYGGMTIFFFYLFPLSSPIIVLVAGMIRYPLRWMLVFSFTGLALKYHILAWIFG